MLFPKLNRFCPILLFLLCEQINTGWMSRLSRYQSVSQFSQGSNATLLVKGDTVSGCKLVLLDRVRNKTCCFSTPEREESMCEPSIQSGGCRSLESVKVEEHPGYCKIIFSEIKLEDTGRYMVIFPGNVSNNKEFEVKVEDKSDERLISGLPPISAISMFEEVQDFLPGTTATLSVPGYEAGSGCMFLTKIETLPVVTLQPQGVTPYATQTPRAPSAAPRKGTETPFYTCNSFSTQVQGG